MKTTNSLSPVKGRARMVALLEDQRAELIDLMFQVEQAHENVKAPGSTALHDLFDKVWEDLGNYADRIAQRVRLLGEVPQEAAEWMKKKAGHSAHSPADGGWQEEVSALAGRLSMIGRQIRSSAIAAGAVRDGETAGLFKEIGRGLEKDLWLAETSNRNR